MKSDGDRERAKNKPLLFWECRERKREQRLEVKRPGADGTVERPSVDLSLFCAVSLKSWHWEQDSSSATTTGSAWSKLRRAQRSDGVNQGTLEAPLA
jgi:hypothetical protein